MKRAKITAETPDARNQYLTQSRGATESTSHNKLCAYVSMRNTNNRSHRLLTCRNLALLVLSGFVFLVGCETTPTFENKVVAKLSHQVTAVGYPLAFFTQQLVGDSVDVRAIVPKDESLESWRPTREEIVSMQRSDLIIINGSAAPFAKWLPHVTLPESKLCRSANDGLKLSDMITVEDIRIVHSHGPEGEHSHPTMVAHSWLAPLMIRKQVNVIAEMLIKTYPSRAKLFEQNRLALSEQLGELSQKIETLKSGTSSQIVITSSPDLKFLTHALGWTDFHFTFSELPNIDSLKQEIDAKISDPENRPTLMLWSMEPEESFLAMTVERKLQNVIIETMTYSPKTGDYFSVMGENLNRLSMAVHATEQNLDP